MPIAASPSHHSPHRVAGDRLADRARSDGPPDASTDDPTRTPAIDPQTIDALLLEHHTRRLPRFERFWSYYRNIEHSPSPASDHRPSAWRLAQAKGLPGRLSPTRKSDPASAPAEIVIENDIAWRIHAMVDFMFGKPVRIESTASDPALRRRIERVLDAVWQNSGGIALLQDMALLGHVFGHVDLLLRSETTATPPRPGDQRSEEPADIAQGPRVEIIDPTRGVPVLSAHDYRSFQAYIVALPSSRPAQHHADPAASLWGRLLHASLGLATGPAKGHAHGSVLVVTDRTMQRLHAGRVVDAKPHHLGAVPVVHIQNTAQPFRFEGLGEVEPLIPLQDELNTRLSDRASRVTMQSFKMFLAKGIEGFDTMPVGPGRVWSTDNERAEITAFGGDADSPSETRHIAEIREALDKSSGVPPVASGVIRARIGNLSSGNALRITLIGLLTKTARKRVAYGRGIEAMCGLMLRALDASGALTTDPADRGVRLVWPDPLPDTVLERAMEAKAKRELGVPTERVLAELGYGPGDPGVQENTPQHHNARRAP